MTTKQSDDIAEVFLACKAMLARAVSRLIPPSEIEDIVQETYVRACTFQANNAVSNQRALMLKTARNLAIDYLKSAPSRYSVPMDEASLETAYADIDDRDSALRKAATDEEFAQFCEAVRLLPQQCRRVFVLKKVYGYSQREIAQKLDLSESTVEKHVAKGLSLCASHMLRHGDTATGHKPNSPSDIHRKRRSV